MNKKENKKKNSLDYLYKYHSEQIELMTNSFNQNNYMFNVEIDN